MRGRRRSPAGSARGSSCAGSSRVVPGADLTVDRERRRRRRDARAARLSRPRLGDLLARRRRSTASAGGAAATRRSAPPRSSARSAPTDAWFGLGDLDLATHLFRTSLLGGGRPAVGGDRRDRARGSACAPRCCPMSDDPVTTRIDVRRRAASGSTCTSRSTGSRAARRDDGEGVRYEGAERRDPAPGRARGDRGRRRRACSAPRTRSSRSARSSRSRGSARRVARPARPRRRGVSGIVGGRAGRRDGRPADAGGRDRGHGRRRRRALPGRSSAPG